MTQLEEQLIEELTAAANFMRGMWLDPAVPSHAKGALMSRAQQIEAVIEAAIEGGA